DRAIGIAGNGQCGFAALPLPARSVCGGSNRARNFSGGHRTTRLCGVCRGRRRMSVAQMERDVAERDWWRGAAIYQIYPRSFADSNADGIGDLPGITARLEHIASLGVDAIWLSPFFKSPMKDFGYDVADYCEVDPIFGTLRDFDRLVHRAHQLRL